MGHPAVALTMTGLQFDFCGRARIAGRNRARATLQEVVYAMVRPQSPNTVKKE
jgi:hypothetical protein